MSRYEDLRTGNSAFRWRHLTRFEISLSLSMRWRKWTVFVERLPSAWFDTLLEAIEDIAPIFEKESQVYGPFAPQTYRPRTATTVAIKLLPPHCATLRGACEARSR